MELSPCVWFITSSAAAGRAWGSGLPSFHAAGRARGDSSLPAFLSQQQSPGSDQEQQCRLSYSLPEIYSSPSVAKALHLCASACDGYSPLNAQVCVWW